jgi:ribosomal protein S18 acetylase RimI-like enzyme
MGIRADPAIELTWLVVAPSCARRGIGTKLLRWGLDLCDQHGLLAYVESTVEAAETFYEKAGFLKKERIRRDLCGKGKSDRMYEEVACIYKPQSS